MLEFKVTGMTCDGCVNSVRRAVERAVPGSNPKVDLARGQLLLDAEPAERSELERRVIDAVTKAGFGAEVCAT